MVSVAHSISAQAGFEDSLNVLSKGLSSGESEKIRSAAGFARSIYGDSLLGSGEGAWNHALGMALILAGLRLDADSRLAALLFATQTFDDQAAGKIEETFGAAPARLVKGVSRLNGLRPITHGFVAYSAEDGEQSLAGMKAQIEILRKMLLSMVEDIRVVLLRLASRTQTLRYYADTDDPLRTQVARETLELYSPLANRLGVWELKWELEDLSFRFLHPDIYRNIARQIDEKRGERERFIADAVARLRGELAAAGIHAEIYGRPKHIYSIWSKMRRKGLDFSKVYDVRALRVIVDEVRDCYTALGLVHNLWVPIPKEFDDYISNPKGNNYRSLHTAVHCPDGRSLEVQIRTKEMHRHAELGVAAHWRYKEGGKSASGGEYDEKIAWLRQLLTWKDEVTDSSDWVRHYKEAALDETVYVMTPQGRVVDLPRGATPVDFAYRVHTDLGHRCRGAKVDGALVTLNTQLETGQRVEIIAAKEGGPSRDWLNPTLGYLFTHRSRAKVRQWFSAKAQEEAIAEGKTIVYRELQRMGETGARIEEVAGRLGFSKPEDLFVAASRADPRYFQSLMRSPTDAPPDPAADMPLIRKPHSGDDSDKGILIVGVDKLLTQLALCCKPAPPDPIIGFVTRGKGVSIHRADCSNFAHMEAMHPERVIETAWGGRTEGVFAVDIVVEANDRQGLLRDVSEIFTREKINVVAVSSQSKQDLAHMRFTAEISNVDQIKRILTILADIDGVVSARRA
ncbi:MAG: bifunctional (p)ppGpp synthetase/guanosine-3',5'-bis(diphosphate) 3'-pyrophosphohydrolase [Candidatus Accumulibacter sp.]|jgi:GTP pyrophosphokinase|nr:bifunctional (p)ppGpp synthetase/guanosine-3',5'-bis(diphosphate) 3'-pyrophosphohydrolase [Accumulibacter sp.]